MKTEKSSYDAKFWKPKIEENITFYKAYLRNFGFDKHVHNDYTISVIKDGVMDAFMQGETLCFRDSHVILINPDEVHSNASEYDKGYKQYSLYMNSSYMKKLLGIEKIQDLFFTSKALEDINLARQFILLLEQNENNLISNFDFECRLVDLLNKVILENISKKVPQILKPRDLVIKRAKEYINDNYCSNFSLEDIVQELDISKYYFLRLFKQTTFLSPMSYLMARRIEKAKEKLQKGLPLIQTAHECGFYDQSHFNRRFKSVFGITPKEYKKLFI